jgi:hypothetical protein
MKMGDKVRAVGKWYKWSGLTGTIKRKLPGREAYVVEFTNNRIQHIERAYLVPEEVYNSKLYKALK